MNKGAFGVLVAASCIGLVVGGMGLYERLTQGLTPVAFGSHVPWGLWVAFYLLFLGLSAGSFLVTMLAYVAGMKQFQRIGPLAAFMVLVVLLCEMQFILYDLGSMGRAFYQFFLTPSFTSMLTWMFVLFSAMFVLYALKLFFLLRGPMSKRSRPGDAHMVHRLAWISLPVGLAFYVINGAFFAVVMHRPVWNSAFTPVLFLLEALLSGGALVVVLTHFLSGRKASAQASCPAEGVCLDLGRIVAWLLVVFLVFEAVFFLVGYKSGDARMVAALDYIAFGPHPWLFWGVHLALGSALPLLLLLGQGRSPGAVAWACLLIVLCFAAVRYNFVVPDLAIPSLAGLGDAFVHPRLSSQYVPNLNEWLVSLWVISFGMLVFLVGARVLPVAPDQQGGEHHA